MLSKILTSHHRVASYPIAVLEEEYVYFFLTIQCFVLPSIVLPSFVPPHYCPSPLLSFPSLPHREDDLSLGLFDDDSEGGRNILRVKEGRGWAGG